MRARAYRNRKSAYSRGEPRAWCKRELSNSGVVTQRVTNMTEKQKASGRGKKYELHVGFMALGIIVVSFFVLPEKLESL